MRRGRLASRIPLAVVKWSSNPALQFFRSGFQEATHHIVKGREDRLILQGVVNATDTYEGFLGKLHTPNLCSEIEADEKLRSEILLTTVTVTERSVVMKCVCSHPRAASLIWRLGTTNEFQFVPFLLRIPAISQVGWHKLCVSNTRHNEVFDAGTVEVGPYFSKTGREMYDTNRIFVLPCITAKKTSKEVEAWAEAQVWLPDGIGVWRATIDPGVAGTDHEFPTLTVKDELSENFTEYPVSPRANDATCLSKPNFHRWTSLQSSGIWGFSGTAQRRRMRRDCRARAFAVKFGVFVGCVAKQ